jgi:hypothetical protein
MTEKKIVLVQPNKNPESKIISIGNEIIKIRYKLTLPTQKLLLFLISHISYEERKEGKFLHTLHFPISSIYEFFKKTGRENDKNLKKLVEESIEELKVKTIDLKKLLPNEMTDKTTYAWYSEIRISDDKKTFKFSFNDKLACALLKIKGYFKSYLKEYIYLRSTHAIHLYMFFRAHEHLRNKQRRISIEELKTYLQVNKNKSYERWDLFKREVLDKSIQQLNENTNYFFTYTLDRGIKQAIGFINFSMIEKTDKIAISAQLNKKIESHLLKKKVYKTYYPLFENVKFVFDDTESFLFILIPMKYFNNFHSAPDYLEFRAGEKKAKELSQKLKTLFKEYDFKKLFNDFFKRKVKGDFVIYDVTKKEIPSVEYLHQSLKIIKEENYF